MIVIIGFYLVLSLMLAIPCIYFFISTVTPRSKNKKNRD